MKAENTQPQSLDEFKALWTELSLQDELKKWVKAMVVLQLFSVESLHALAEDPRLLDGQVAAARHSFSSEQTGDDALRLVNALYYLMANNVAKPERVLRVLS